MLDRAEQSTSWRFPPRSGGADYISDSASAHFSVVPIQKEETAMSRYSQIALPDVPVHRASTFRGSPIRSTC